MLRIIGSALRITTVTWLLCGIAYPLVINGLAQTLFPVQANGSMIFAAGGHPLGSRLIGQNWQGDQWFHGRPSATTDADPNDASKTVAAPYNAGNSSGSNLGPASAALRTRMLTDRAALETAQPNLRGKLLPADMLTTSASGLDPDISPDNARLQATRVAQAHAIPEQEIESLINAHIQPPAWGIFGEPRVNVLELNMALQAALGSQTRTR
ncbi:potassium-transporting ATPase subunit C [Serratia marcescens]|uniref:Potassium-transporting ATPase KdpC subunit n=1 Tax=Serratia marcescens TaxID=615 RepID=A0A1Q4P588_SERMA|nr:potassium-transporting ATPase subunit KdpC [Serratia marcescens]OKB68290.1 potassium-transporting ATPase subunit C [Serratia marcescens]